MRFAALINRHGTARQSYIRHASIRLSRTAAAIAKTRRMTHAPSQLHCLPARAEGLARLEAFLPRLGWRYVSHCNGDPGPERRGGTSLLSPYVRRRMVSEREVVGAVLDAEGLKRAEKFIQEVCWRTYWKGWLEARPEVWTAFSPIAMRRETISGRARPRR